MKSGRMMLKDKHNLLIGQRVSRDAQVKCNIIALRLSNPDAEIA